MAKNLVVKTNYIGDYENLSNSFCVIKRKLYKQIVAEINAFFEEKPGIELSLDLYNGMGELFDRVTLTADDIFDDDTIEVISISKVTAEEMIEVFGHEYGQTSLLEIWATIRGLQDSEEDDLKAIDENE